MTDDQRDRIAAEALGALDAEESDALRADLERDPTLAAELDEYRATVATLESSIAREQPSHDLFSGILAEIEPEPEPVPAATPAPRSRSWRRALPAFAVGVAATISVFAVALALDRDDVGTPDAVAAVQGAPDFEGVHGEARLYGSTNAGGTLQLELGDVPAAPEGQHYEVWVLRTNAGETMEAVGVFDPTTPDVDLELGLPGPGEYVAVDISVEQDAGPPEHSGTSLAGGKFEPRTT